MREGCETTNPSKHASHTHTHAHAHTHTVLDGSAPTRTASPTLHFTPTAGASSPLHGTLVSAAREVEAAKIIHQDLIVVRPTYLLPADRSGAGGGAGGSKFASDRTMLAYGAGAAHTRGMAEITNESVGGAVAGKRVVVVVCACVYCWHSLALTRTPCAHAAVVLLGCWCGRAGADDGAGVDAWRQVGGLEGQGVRWQE